jgi:putative membrane protein
VGLGLWRAFGLVTEPPKSVTIPLIVYIGNFAFATVMSLAAGFYVPIAMGMITGLIPAILCWRTANQGDTDIDGDAALDTAITPSANAALK